MAFYQIADSYVQRVPGSKSALKAFEHGEFVEITCVEGLAVEREYQQMQVLGADFEP